MKKDEFKIMNMVRKIRDNLYEKMKGKNAEEQIRFYHEESKKFRKKLEKRFPSKVAKKNRSKRAA